MKVIAIILSLIGDVLYYIILAFVLIAVVVWCTGKSVQEWWERKTF